MQTDNPKRRDDILTQESGDEIMLYDSDVDEMHILNPTAQVIWELCDGTHSLEQIASAVRTKFAVPADVDVAGDVQKTLSEFTTKKPLDMNPDVAALLSDYKITVDIVVAWSDMDALNHVNNAVYLTYFETARITYFDALGLRDYRDEHRVGPILGSVNLRYRIPLTYPDTVTVGTRITELRDDRFEMDMLIVSHQHKKIATSGGCTTFAYDYNLLRKATWPDVLNQRMIEFEGLPQ